MISINFILGFGVGAFFVWGLWAASAFFKDWNDVVPEDKRRRQG